MTQEDYEILDMVAGDDGSFVLGAIPEEPVAPAEPSQSPMIFELDAPATIAVASFGAGLLLGLLFRRRTV